MLALGAWLSLASCGEVCPADQPNCGSPNGSSAGAAGSAGSASCEQLKAFRACLDSFCKAAQNPFCTCYRRGFDLSQSDCSCIAFDGAKFCRQADLNGISASDYSDCSVTNSSVATICVGVQ